jgi:hypothetical protein
MSVQLTYDHPNYHYRLMLLAKGIVYNATPEEIKAEIQRRREIYGDTEADDLAICCRAWWMELNR